MSVVFSLVFISRSRVLRDTCVTQAWHRMSARWEAKKPRGGCWRAFEVGILVQHDQNHGIPREDTQEASKTNLGVAAEVARWTDLYFDCIFFGFVVLKTTMIVEFG